jgi:hypothetical protein
MTAALVALIVEIGLRVTTLPTLARVVSVPLVMDDTTSASLSGGEAMDLCNLPRVSIERAQAARAVVRRWPFGDSCLRRALVIGHVLRLHQPRLEVGVRRERGIVSAHAWLIIDGRPLDPEAVSFVALRRMGES